MIKYKDLEVNFEFDFGTFMMWFAAIVMSSLATIALTAIILTSMLEGEVECYYPYSYSSDSGFVVYQIKSRVEWGSNVVAFKTPNKDEFEAMLDKFPLCGVPSGEE